MGFIANAIGRRDEADFFLAAPHGIGHRRDNGPPDRFRVLEKGEFRQQHIGAVTAHRIRPSRHRDDPAPARKLNGHRLQQRFRTAVPLLPDVGNGHLVSLGPLLPFGQGLDGLPLRRRGDQPGRFAAVTLVFKTIAHSFLRRAKILARLARH